MTESSIPATAEFWRALEDGEFLLRECRRCERRYFPPSPVCPHCGSGDVGWTPTEEEGSLYSYTCTRRTAPGFDEPVVIGIVELSGGVRVLSLVDAEYDDLSIGDRVSLVAYEYEGGFDRGPLDDEPFFKAVPVD